MCGKCGSCHIWNSWQNFPVLLFRFVFILFVCVCCSHSCNSILTKYVTKITCSFFLTRILLNFDLEWHRNEHMKHCWIYNFFVSFSFVLFNPISNFYAHVVMILQFVCTYCVVRLYTIQRLKLIWNHFERVVFNSAFDRHTYTLHTHYTLHIFRSIPYRKIRGQNGKKTTTKEMIDIVTIVFLSSSVFITMCNREIAGVQVCRCASVWVWVCSLMMCLHCAHCNRGSLACILDFPPGMCNKYADRWLAGFSAFWKIKLKAFLHKRTHAHAHAHLHGVS